MTQTPTSQRLHIGIFGNTNCGKSSFLNAITGQNHALVSEIAGTTTDLVFKPMEISGIGAVVFIDTAGFEDTTELGQERIKKTFLALEKTDVALILFNPENLLNQDYDKNQFEKNFLDSQIANLIEKLKQEKKPFILAINKIDLFDTEENQLLLKDFSDFIERFAKEKPIQISTKQKIGIENIKQELLRKVPEDFQ
jgi:small GTP-binding protein